MHYIIKTISNKCRQKVGPKNFESKDFGMLCIQCCNFNKQSNPTIQSKWKLCSFSPQFRDKNQRSLLLIIQKDTETITMLSIMPPRSCFCITRIEFGRTSELPNSCSPGHSLFQARMKPSIIYIHVRLTYYAFSCIPRLGVKSFEFDHPLTIVTKLPSFWAIGICFLEETNTSFALPVKKKTKQLTRIKGNPNEEEGRQAGRQDSVFAWRKISLCSGKEGWVGRFPDMFSIASFR